jgi:hypothetical protein
MTSTILDYCICCGASQNAPCIEVEHNYVRGVRVFCKGYFPFCVFERKRTEQCASYTLSL